MAKSNRGGQRGTTNRVIPRNKPSAPPQIDDTTQASSFDKDYSDFLKLDEDGRIDVISQAITEDVPVHLSNTDFQKVLYNLEFNDAPDVVDDKTLDKMNGTEMFRTVNSTYDKIKDINYTPEDIAEQIQTGSTTRTSDNGGSRYGRGIYFASDYNDSIGYGRAQNDITKTAVVRAKLNSNAKVIGYGQAVKGANDEIRNGTKLGKMLAKCDYDSQSSIYALTKGYNVMDNGSGYYVILNRRAITMSKDVKATHYGKGW